MRHNEVASTDQIKVETCVIINVVENIKFKEMKHMDQSVEKYV